MPLTVIYHERPRCAECGQPMDSWIMLATEHYHDECRAKRSSRELQAILDGILRERQPAPADARKETGP